MFEAKTVAIPLKELIEHRSILLSIESTQQCCCYCGVLLQETITGRECVPKGEACSVCYYEKLGEGVEEHPVVSGRVRRG
jgi:hypothetical protein